jgi:hypothetical protein
VAFKYLTGHGSVRISIFIISQNRDEFFASPDYELIGAQAWETRIKSIVFTILIVLVFSTVLAVLTSSGKSVSH